MQLARPLAPPTSWRAGQTYPLYCEEFMTLSSDAIHIAGDELATGPQDFTCPCKGHYVEPGAGLGAISLRPQHALAPGHQCPGYPSKLFRERDSGHFGRPPSK